jgi:hypothetical protein
MESGRQQARAAVDLEVAFEEGGRQLFTPAVNLSVSGVLLSSDQPPAIGSYVQVVLSLPPTGVFVRLQGDVVRHTSPNAPSGFAVAFRAVDRRTATELESFVAQARQH